MTVANVDRRIVTLSERDQAGLCALIPVTISIQATVNSKGGAVQREA